MIDRNGWTIGDSVHSIDGDVCTIDRNVRTVDANTCATHANFRATRAHVLLDTRQHLGNALQTLRSAPQTLRGLQPLRHWPRYFGAALQLCGIRSTSYETRAEISQTRSLFLENARQRFRRPLQRSAPTQQHVTDAFALVRASLAQTADPSRVRQPSHSRIVKAPHRARALGQRSAAGSQRGHDAVPRVEDQDVDLRRRPIRFQ